MTGARGSRSPRTAWQAGSASTSVVPRGRGTSRADDRSPGRVPCACREVGMSTATNSRWRSPCARVPPPVPSASSGPHRRGGPHCFRAPSTCGSGPSGRTDGPTPAATHEEQPRPPSCGTNDLNFGWGAEGVVSPSGRAPKTTPTAPGQSSSDKPDQGRRRHVPHRSVRQNGTAGTGPANGHLPSAEERTALDSASSGSRHPRAHGAGRPFTTQLERNRGRWCVRWRPARSGVQMAVRPPSTATVAPVT